MDGLFRLIFGGLIFLMIASVAVKVLEVVFTFLGYLLLWIGGIAIVGFLLIGLVTGIFLLIKRRREARMRGGQNIISENDFPSFQSQSESLPQSQAQVSPRTRSGSKRNTSRRSRSHANERMSGRVPENLV